MGVITFGPLCYGFLLKAASGKLHGLDVSVSPRWVQELLHSSRIDRLMEVAAALVAVANEAECSLPQLLLLWNTSQPGVTTTLVGSRVAGHVRENAQAGFIQVDSAVLRRVDHVVAEYRDAGAGG
jgi:aryl-alcohol dehydrogenase-like predicted oxidoreductase